MTAEENLKKMIEIMPWYLSGKCKPYIIEALKLYRKEGIEQALKDAADRAQNEISPVLKFQRSKIKQSILETPINLD